MHSGTAATSRRRHGMRGAAAAAGWQNFFTNSLARMAHLRLAALLACKWAKLAKGSASASPCAAYIAPAANRHREQAAEDRNPLQFAPGTAFPWLWEEAAQHSDTACMTLQNRPFGTAMQPVLVSERLTEAPPRLPCALAYSILQDSAEVFSGNESLQARGWRPRRRARQNG